MSKEIPLTGGRNIMDVVRVGDTVRKPQRANTVFLHRLLRHLEQNGFQGSPRVRGFDENGREILTFIEGVPASHYSRFNDRQLTAVSCLIRKLHDATASTDLRGDQEVVAHSDLAPSNTIFRDDMPCAFIDFDCARPASRAFDLGYAAWQWLDLGNDNYSPAEQARRFALFVKAYGDITIKEVFENVLIRQQRLIDQGMERKLPEMEQKASQDKEWCLKNRLTLVP